MKVLVAAFWMSPCTLLVAVELASTLTGNLLTRHIFADQILELGIDALVTVVCELAMLPEIFCSANDCALRPETAVVRASKIPMTVLHSDRSGRRTTPRMRKPQYAVGFANLVPEIFFSNIIGLSIINDVAPWLCRRRSA